MTDFNFNEFIAMGGYAKYVWSSWGLTVFAMISLVVNALRKRKQVYRQHQQHMQQFAARQERTVRQ